MRVVDVCILFPASSPTTSPESFTSSPLLCAWLTCITFPASSPTTSRDSFSPSPLLCAWLTCILFPHHKSRLVFLVAATEPFVYVDPLPARYPSKNSMTSIFIAITTSHLVDIFILHHSLSHHKLCFAFLFSARSFSYDAISTKLQQSKEKPSLHLYPPNYFSLLKNKTRKLNNYVHSQCADFVI